MSLLVFTTTYESGNSRVLDPLLRALKTPCTLVLRLSRFDIPPPPKVTVLSLRENGRRAPLFTEVIRLARLIDELKPRTVLSMLTGPNIIAVLARSLARYKPRLVLSEHTMLPDDLRRAGVTRRLLTNMLVPLTYPHADAIVTVSHALAQSLKKTYRLPAGLLHPILNPIPVTKVRGQARSAIGHPWLSQNIPILAAVGRLSVEKGFDVLLEALAKVRTSRRVRLWLIGDGPERRRLGAEAVRLGIAGDVQFLGFQRNPYAYIARAALLVHPARWEGFGNAIAEALALGIPVVATSCPGGPTEILRNGRDGVLVPPDDSSSLARAIERLVSSPKLRLRYAARGRRRAAAFDAPHAIHRYARVLRVPLTGRSARTS
jgi:glycosyltransferase involved in cell wall biosynthesis